MKILVTGSEGMLAKAIIEIFKNEDLFTFGKEELDITNKQMVEDKVCMLNPEYIINCAAYTNVDLAEKEQEQAMQVNYYGVKNLVEVAKKYNSTLIHISTDYVFDGNLDINCEYKEEDITNPKTIYGKTKLKGEEVIIKNLQKYYIFRTAWLYGDGKNFVSTILKLGKEKTSIDVVNDQYGSPTYTKDLAQIIAKAIEYKIPYGLYHATNNGETNWCEFAKKILELANIKCKVNEVTSKEYIRPAQRPKNSKLSKQKLKKYNIIPKNYIEALKQYLGGIEI